jgi:protein-tyrosine phosphatase
MIDSSVHILPDVDDGAKDEEQAIYMLEKAKADGITHWIVTPHYDLTNEKYTYEILRNKYDEWFQAYGEKYASGNLIFGMEVKVDEFFLENLDKMSRLPTFENSHYMLVVFDITWTYEQIKEAVVRLISYGVVPILAHAECYLDMAENPYKLKLLSEEGVLIQLTASSFTKKNDQKFIRELLMMNAVDLVASEGYDSTTRPPILSEAYDVVARYYSKAWANRLFFETPMKIFYGEHYLRPLNTVKLRKSYSVSMGVSVAFGITLLAIGISQMIDQPPSFINDLEVVITEEAIPAGYVDLTVYDEIIARGNAQSLEIYENFDADLSAIHELINKTFIEISDLKVRNAQINAYLAEAKTLETQYDTAISNLIDELEIELENNGYTTEALNNLNSDYHLFKESIKTKYLVIF